MEQLNVFQAIILGIVQGLSEFLPISSSGHLILVRDVLHYPDPGKTFDVITHMGTLIALLIFFRNDLKEILMGTVASLKNGRLFGNFQAKLFWFMVISTIPGGLFGFLFHDTLEKINNIYLICGLLITFGIILYLTDRLSKKEFHLEKISLKDATLVGVAQALAMIPGVSRSGISMTAAMALGYTREAAARYSFLISVPLIGGISLYELLSLLKHGPDKGVITVYAAGLLAAMASGIFCIKFLLDYLKKGSFTLFAVYRVLLGISLIIMAIAGVVKSTGQM